METIRKGRVAKLCLFGTTYSMFNCLILGSGRSGTSMMGGILHEAGYFMGDYLYPGRESNPKGFFETPEINSINEAILEHCVRAVSTDQTSVNAPGRGQYWLMSLPEDHSVESADPAVAQRMAAILERRPFAFKDPRFSYTLPAWKPYLPAMTKFIVMFRPPETTATSILKECRTAPYLQNLQIDAVSALEVWKNIYRHILRHYLAEPDRFIFVHYVQCLRGDGVKRVADFLETPLHTSFVDVAMNRSGQEVTADSEALALYRRLCALAGFSHDSEH